MNQLIKELAEQAGSTHKQSLGVYQFYTNELEKFAELIVRECIKVAMRSVSDDESKEAWYLIQEHFGVQE